MIDTDRDKILRLLRESGKALASGTVGRRIRPRLYANAAARVLYQLERDGLVESRPSGCGRRWWAVPAHAKRPPESYTIGPGGHVGRVSGEGLPKRSR